MKYCPYCGAALAGGAVSFCAECGKAMPSPKKASEPVRHAPQRSAAERRMPPTGETAKGNRRKAGRAAPPPGKTAHKGLRTLPQRSGDKLKLPSKPRPDPRDEGYDGYYDDVKPIDNGHIRDRADPVLAKRITILAAGAFAIVIFTVLLMYLL